MHHASCFINPKNNVKKLNTCPCRSCVQPLNYPAFAVFFDKKIKRINKRLLNITDHSNAVCREGLSLYRTYILYLR